ncbi:MAG: GTPase ObgE [Clostridiales bacterium]|nr:GTPase ObgE [Clostridiales bacterium]
MFHDHVKINVKGGDGGHGMVAFRREKYVPLGGPAGGDGGRGGHVIFEGDANLKTLIDFKYRRHYKAPKGSNGMNKNKTGANAEDLLVKTPLGTLVRDEDGQQLADIVCEGQRAVVAKGGRGGRGNSSFASGRNKAPEYAEKGEPGEERWLTLELKLLADVGLIGLPNAGKSTLVSKVSAANPKIADYPFTTLTPNLGMVRLSDEKEFVMADLPGLIEGAATGIGLGHRFLRHAERCRVLVQVLDISPGEGRDVLADFSIIQEELRLYRADLNMRPLIVAANKMDMPGAADNLEILRSEIGEDHQILPISALTGEGLQTLLWQISQTLDDAPPVLAAEPQQDIRHTVVRAEQPFAVARDGEGIWQVSGGRVEKLVAMTDLQNDAAVLRMQRIFIKMGLEDALREAGAQAGDIVEIAGNQFEYAE